MHSAVYAALGSGEYRAWGSDNEYKLNDGTTAHRYTPITPQNTSAITSWRWGPFSTPAFGIR